MNLRAWRAAGELLVLVPCVVGADTLIDGVAAQVNEHSITIGEVLTAMDPVRRKLAETVEGEELARRLRKAYGNALTMLIDRRVILVAYEEQQQKLPEWAIDNRVKEIISDLFDGDRKALLESLAKENLTFEEWREEVSDHMAVASLRAFNVDQRVQIAPSALSRAYRERVEQFRTPERVKLRMIVFKKPASKQEASEKRRLAEDVRNKLAQGQDFALLAKTLSEGSQASSGGDWGWIEPEKILRPELAKAALSLAPSEVSEVIETADEIYILKSEGRKESSVTPFADVRQELEQDLRRAERERLYSNWIGRLKERACVTVFDRDPFGVE